MKTAYRLLAILLLFTIANLASAQVRLAEIAPTNTGQINDEDNDAPDWLELYNTGSGAVDLAGYSLSDHLKAGQWLFPSHLLGPGERLLVFVSGKNRGTGIADPNTVNHWETAVYESDLWRYFIGTTAPPADWANAGFDDASWDAAPGGFGYGDGDDATQVPAGTLSYFLRKNFTVADTAQMARALLSLDYDDGFAAYLNGVEIARSANLPANAAWDAVTSIDHEALMYSGGDPESFFIEKPTLHALLRPGANVLAIEVHNVEPGSSDLSARPWLHFGITSSATFFGPNPGWFNMGGQSGGDALHTNFKLDFKENLSLFDNNGVLLDSLRTGVLQPGHSRMRLNDNGAWCVTDAPTPDAANGTDCLSGYSGKPVFSLAAGFYNGPQTFSITGNGPIRYTTDGGFPDANANLYTGAVQIGQTTVLRARSFEPGKLPGPTATASYFIDEPTTLPIVSVTIDPDDFGEVYDNYSRKGAVSVEYFDKNHQRQFEEDAAGYVVGNWSVAFAQKSLQFDCDEEFGSIGEIEYPLFAPDKPISHLKSFRIRNEDDDWTSARMRDRIVNELAAPTHSGRASYRNAVGFINGEYWGHYTIRERLDNYFCRDNYGADPDSVNMVKTHYGLGNYLPEYGTIDDFYAMSDFIMNNNMANATNLNEAAQLLDFDNFTDYFATEIFVASTDWLQDYFNNVRLFKADKNDRWKFILWDVSYSSGNASGCSACDVLGSTINNPFDSRYGRMFNSLLANQNYKRFFINRFADLMNTAFLPGRAHQLIDASATELAPEINRHNARWGTGDSSSWAYNVLYLKDFYTERPAYQRTHIVNHFNLAGPVNITLNVNPPGAGHIKISTITPENLPWTGVYFNGNPVTLTAVPNPGFEFSNWTNSPFITDPGGQAFTTNITTNTAFTANFNGSSTPAQLEVSEINYHSDPTRDAGDWLELHNYGATPLDLSDWQLRDGDWFHRFVVPTGTVLAPDARMVLVENGSKFAQENPAVTPVSAPLGFELSDKGEAIQVSDPFGNVVEQFEYNDTKPWPCTPDGFGRTLERVAPDMDPNQPASWFDGCIGGSPRLAYSACIENPIISEINYKSDGAFDAGDWLEIFNNSATPLDLGGWSLRDDDDAHLFTIPSGTILPAGAYRVFFQDDAKFGALFPSVTNKTGPLGFGLSGNGDVVRLYDAGGRIQTSVCFNDTAPWPETPDGQGYTLELTLPADNINNPNNWFAGCYGGSPGTAFDPDCGVVGTKEMQDGLQVVVFPNPVGDVLSVRVSGRNSCKVKVFNMLGQMVGEQDGIVETAAVSMQGLPAGMYRVEVSDGKKAWGGVIVKSLRD